MFLMFFGTHMGEKGHRTVFLENLFCTVSALSAIAVGGIWAEIDPEGKKWALLIIVIGSFLFICSVPAFSDRLACLTHHCIIKIQIMQDQKSESEHLSAF